jgi:WD40 repeat protein
MRVLLLIVWAVSALGAEVQFLKPTDWLGDLLVTDSAILVGTTGKILELEKHGGIRRELPFPGGQAQALAWHREKGILAAGGWNFLRLWEWPSGQVFLDITGLGTMARSLAFAGEVLLCGGADGWVLAFDLAGRPLWRLKAHEGPVWGVAAAAELFATADGGRAVLWQLSTRKELFSFPGRAWDVALSAQGFMLAAGVGKLLRIWDTALGLALLEVWAHESCTVAVAFSPKGRGVATGSLDQTAALWDAETGAVLLRTPTFPAVLRAVSFSPDGAVLVAGAEDGTLALIPLAPFFVE